MSNYKSVKKFHDKFEIPRKDKPDFLKPDEMRFRIDFLQEELNELRDATYDSDLELAFDSLIDLVWVALGTADMMGITEEIWDEGFNEVSRANLSKERAEGADDSRSKRKHSLDIIKPEGWTGPDLVKILNKYIKPQTED